MDKELTSNGITLDKKYIKALSAIYRGPDIWTAINRKPNARHVKKIKNIADFILRINKFLSKDSYNTLYSNIIKEIIGKLLTYEENYEEQKELIVSSLYEPDIKDSSYYSKYVTNFKPKLTNPDKMLSYLDDELSNFKDKNRALSVLSLYDRYIRLESVFFKFESHVGGKENDSLFPNKTQFIILFHSINTDSLLYELYGYLYRDDIVNEDKISILIDGIGDKWKSAENQDRSLDIFAINIEINQRSRKKFFNEAEMLRNEEITTVAGAPCPKCKSTNSFYKFNQDRASDEQESVRYTCGECGAMWKR